MYRTLSILLISLISICTAAQKSTVPVKLATDQSIGSASGSTEADRPVDTKLSVSQLEKEAAALYVHHSYGSAARIYEYMISRYGYSDKLYYNLGNTYYKSKNYAPAILNYERALRLNPGDQDSRFNLEMCRTRIVDKINPVGVIIFTHWYQSLGNTFDSNTWGLFSIVLFLLFIASLFGFFFAKVTWLKKSSFFVGILSICVSVLSLVYSGQQRNSIVYPDKAIVFASTINVKSSPDQSGTDLFILHEGSKVTVLSSLGTWSEIELEDGSVGWLETKNIQII
jgi:tetratricopeptide (TPR) repeat protein